MLYKVQSDRLSGLSEADVPEVEMGMAGKEKVDESLFHICAYTPRNCSTMDHSI